MPRINYFAVAAAAIAALAIGAVWYSPLLFGKAYLALRGIDPIAAADLTPSAGIVLAEFIRYFVTAYVLARFVALLGVVNWKGVVELGLWMGIGLQALVPMGALLHENMPFPLYAIHAGDALVKTLVMILIIVVWPRKAA